MVQRAVRLDVDDPAAGRPGERGRGHRSGRGRQPSGRPATPPGLDGRSPPGRRRHLRADGHASSGGGVDHGGHDLRAAGVEPAGDVGAGDQLEQGWVVTVPPWPAPSPRSQFRSMCTATSWQPQRQAGSTPKQLYAANRACRRRPPAASAAPSVSASIR